MRLAIGSRLRPPSRSSIERHGNAIAGGRSRFLGRRDLSPELVPGAQCGVRIRRLAAFVALPCAAVIATAVSGACGRVQGLDVELPDTAIEGGGIDTKIPPDTLDLRDAVDAEVEADSDVDAADDSPLDSFDSRCKETSSLDDLRCVKSTVDASCVTDAIPDAVILGCDALPLGTPDACVGLPREPVCDEYPPPACPTASYPKGCLITFPRPHPYYPCEPIIRGCDPSLDGWVWGS